MNNLDFSQKMQMFKDNFFPKMTKEDADNIEGILKWDEETKVAFMFAKRIFEEDLGKDDK